MGQFSLTHILLLVLLFLIFFGPRRLPQLGQGLGKAIRGFKESMNEIEVDAKDIHDKPQQVSQSQKHQEKNKS